MVDSGDTQDEPIEAQHSQPEGAKVAGILVQQEADLAGHDESEILDALRERFANGGHQISEDDLREHAHRISGLEPNKFSGR